jgi:hypothetical protein
VVATTWSIGHARHGELHRLAAFDRTIVEFHLPSLRSSVTGELPLSSSRRLTSGVWLAMLPVRGAVNA